MYGKYRHQEPNTICVHRQILSEASHEKEKCNADNYTFLLTVIILHEMAHYIRYTTTGTSTPKKFQTRFTYEDLKSQNLGESGFFIEEKIIGGVVGALSPLAKEKQHMVHGIYLQLDVDTKLQILDEVIVHAVSQKRMRRLCKTDLCDINISLLAHKRSGIEVDTEEMVAQEVHPPGHCVTNE